MTKIYEFKIEPVGAVRMTQGQVKLCRMPDKILTSKQLKVKERIFRYMKFKEALALMAMEQKFTLPDKFSVCFLFHTDKIALDGEPHQKKPDWDNCAKSTCDALKKSDQTIYDVHTMKYWTIGPSTIRITCHS